MAKWVKRWLLKSGGGQDPEVEQLTAVKVGDQAAEDHIDLFASLVEWSFELEEQSKIKVVPASLSCRLLSDAIGENINFDEDVPAVAIIDKRVQLLRSWLSRFEQLLIPVYAPAIKGSCQHWTLLMLEKDAAGNVVEVKCFHSLKHSHHRFLSNTKLLLQLLDVDVQRIKGIYNNAFQEVVECGWFVCD